MSETVQVLEYKCPCCGAGLVFGEDLQKMTCEYCDNTFDLDTLRDLEDTQSADSKDTFTWSESTTPEWSEAEQAELNCFICPACGGQLVTDENTAATFCPFCDNPAILPVRLTGGLKPDAVIPFRTGKEDAQNAFRALCKGKPLLPKDFVSTHTIDKITGIYVPYWLYSCEGSQESKYKATRVRRWSDSQYVYTRTDHYLLHRGANASFIKIPQDGSSKMDNAILESIEPYDYRDMTDFDTAYLSGYFADKYDVEASVGEPRIRERVGATMDQLIAPSLIGYSSAIPYGKQLNIRNSKAKYVLFPVWFLHTKYQNKDYTFAMNGQTGKMTGTFPICPKKSFAWFAGVCAAVTAVVALIQWLAL